MNKYNEIRYINVYRLLQRQNECIQIKVDTSMIFGQIIHDFKLDVQELIGKLYV